MKGNIITSIVTNIYTPLQVALGVLLRTPSMIDLMADFKVCASYHEVIRFKASAASVTAKKNSEDGIFCETNGLIQFMSDNFDANINSPNGLKTTHAIALLATLCGGIQTTDSNSTFQDDVIPRLSMNQIKEEGLPDIEQHFYVGHPKPDELSHKLSLSQSLLNEQNVSQSGAGKLDHMFFFKT